MQDWRWPTLLAFGILVAAIVILFVLANDQPTRDHLITYLDTIVPFVLGAAAGGAVGGSVGFIRGIRKQGLLGTGTVRDPSQEQPQSLKNSG